MVRMGKEGGVGEDIYFFFWISQQIIKHLFWNEGRGKDIKGAALGLNAKPETDTT